MAIGQDALLNAVSASEDAMVSTLSKIIAIRSVSPKSGGQGESKRADYLQGVLRDWGFRTERYDYKDDTGTARSNVVVRYGSGKRTLWMVAHIDTVSEGDRSLWRSDPFKAVVKDGRVYGRGSSDNGQSGVASMYALKALKETKARLRYNFGLALVADEELGSVWGIDRLIKDGVFGKDDMFVVPDWGTRNGQDIEVAEKGLLWLKFTVTGKQVHASTPQLGMNAYRQSILFLAEIDSFLHKKYSARDSRFSPDVSTFEMTKHEKNVDSVNIIPGSEVSYIDCRVLPQYKLDSVRRDVGRIARRYKKVGIKIEQFNRADAAPPTKSDAEVVRLLSGAIKDLRGLKPRVVGIGGGTCAGFFRHAGYPAAVWSTEEDVAHQPNEYAIISNMVNDAKVIASLYV